MTMSKITEVMQQTKMEWMTRSALSSRLPEREEDQIEYGHSIVLDTGSAVKIPESGVVLCSRKHKDKQS